MYVAVKGGEAAIDNAHRLLAADRRGDPNVPELTLDQIDQQLALAVDRVMTEGSLYDRPLAALAIKQARGDLVEAIFLLRAYRTTLPRLGDSQPLDTTRMTLSRRVSAVFKDIPGGQILGPTFDYTHRLLDFSLADPTAPPAPPAGDPVASLSDTVARVSDLLGDESLLEKQAASPTETPDTDLTREPLEFPASRAARLQNLARGDEGFLLSLGYATQRGFGSTHPFSGEIRVGEVGVELHVEELGFAVVIGDITVTECDMINQFAGSATEPPSFTRGYGLTFGYCERKAMSMALVDRALRCTELGETVASPAHDAEFVLYHSDNVEASGFVQHLKLPHYVDFQAELDLLRGLRQSVAELDRNNEP